MAGGNSKFGIYDSEYNIFMELPESMHGSILIRSNQSGTGWLICNAEARRSTARCASLTQRTTRPPASATICALQTLAASSCKPAL